MLVFGGVFLILLGVVATPVYAPLGTDAFFLGIALLIIGIALIVLEAMS